MNVCVPDIGLADHLPVFVTRKYSLKEVIARKKMTARLIKQGYSQAKGVDYDEMFSPVARNTSGKSLFVLANAHDLEIHQMDVKTAFLNGSVDHEIYMPQPEAFELDRPNHVYKLKKSIYGFKQSARPQFEIFL